MVGILGLFINGSSDLNLLNINQPDNALHLASAALGLYFGLSRQEVAPAEGALQKSAVAMSEDRA